MSLSIKRFLSLTALVLSCVMLFQACSPKTAKNDDADQGKKIKAGFIYVGPIGDYGWSHAHDLGRQYVEEKFDWLETTYVESVADADTPRVIDRLIMEEKCDVVFTTSFGFMDATIEAGAKYPDKIFMHCSGYKQAENVGTYFTDLYQMYYLNGLMAGALSESKIIGYVGAFPIPEVVRHINAFAIGAKEVQPDIEVRVKWINAWYDPVKAREAAEALIIEGCDALAFTEDTPAVIEVGKDHTEKGKQIYTFSHYSPMQQYGENTVVSGQLCDWGLMYEEILEKIYNEQWESGDMLWLANKKTALLGGNFDEKINKVFEEPLKSKKINDPILGQLSIYDLVLKRLDQYMEPTLLHEPFTGPIVDQKGVLKLKPNERATVEQLWTIDWFVEGVVGEIPAN
jgi:basic membrane protein A and related proteins